MRVVALEEHILTPGVISAWKDLDQADRDLAMSQSTGNDKERLLLDLEDCRLAAMNEAGIDVQVLSLTTPGVQTIDAARSLTLAQEANDLIAATVRRHPDRFQGFATLPLSAPDLAAQELERAVVDLGHNGAMLFGRVGERNIDHPDFGPVLEMAARLQAPIYLHPQTPQIGVRRAYYHGLGEAVDARFATSAVGWHYETGMQVIRLVLSGAFDRLPNLRIILGHWGEVVLFYLERIEPLASVAKLPRSISDYFRQHIWVTPSGMLSRRYLNWAIDVLGVDRIMFATDFPFILPEARAGRRFLEEASLNVSDRVKIASDNWDRLVRDIRR